MEFPHGETVIVRRGRAVVDPYSGEVERIDFDDPIDTPYEGCAVGPRVTSEPAIPGETPVLTEGTVFSPHVDMDVTARDRLVIRGREWDIEGEPFLWRSPLSGWTPGLQINVTRREG